MNNYEATELAYKNGYEAGKKDASASAKDFGDCYIYGYRATELALIAELLKRNHISEEELHTMFEDFSKMYNIIVDICIN